MQFQIYCGKNTVAEFACRNGVHCDCRQSAAMQNHANMPRDLIFLLVGEAMKMATKLDWLTVMTLEGVAKSRVEYYCGKIPSFASYLKTFGEAGIVTTGKDGQVGSRGVTMIFVGYADKHGGDCY